MVPMRFMLTLARESTIWSIQKLEKAVNACRLTEYHHAAPTVEPPTVEPPVVEPPTVEYHQPPDQPEPPSKRPKKADAPHKGEKKPLEVQPCDLQHFVLHLMFHFSVLHYSVMVGPGVGSERTRQSDHWEWGVLEWPSHACCTEALAKAVPRTRWFTINIAESDWWFWDCVQWR